MTTTLPLADRPKLTKRDFESDQDVRWCPGCGDYAILSAVQKALPATGRRPEDIVFVSGIGCSSRFPYYMNTYGFHTIHGRAPAVALGIKAANPNLHIYLVTGDGDGLSIGGNHLLHVLRRNLDVTILLFNNRIYGLTKGQASPASELGKVTKSTPFGSIDRPVDPIGFAIGAGATFVARTVDRFLPHMEYVLQRASTHRGAKFIEIYQNCNIFNDGAFKYLTERDAKLENELKVENGKPLTFGPVDRRRAIKLNGLRPEIVPYEKGAEGGLWVYDETDKFHASTMENINYPEFPVPIGVFYNTEAPSYVDEMIRQENDQLKAKGAGNLQNLLTGRETWTVK